MAVIMAPDDGGIEAAVEALGAHMPVAIPTETVYGLAGGTFDEAAIAQIYALKGRPMNNPLIAHVSGSEMAQSLVSAWDTRADALAGAFWPGPLTLILARAEAVPSVAAGGHDTLAVRAPDHPVAQGLLAAVDGPLSAPSANRSGRISPTQASHVVDDYADLEAAAGLIVLEGGPSRVGLESTVIDLCGPVARLTRPGSITRAQIEAAAGPLEDAVPWTQSNAPGTSASHYAPQTPLRLVDSLDGADQASILTLPADPVEAAARLYDLLRKADAQGQDEIVIMTPPDSPPWRALRDRLQRAAT